MSTVIKDLGAVSAYAYAVEKGYMGTETEFAELMADYAEVGQRAEDAAESALNSKTAAQTAATTATNKVSKATTAAQTAITNAGEAQTSAQTATQKATEATQSALQALGYKNNAESAKTASQTAQGLAESARDGAITAKTAAETAQGKAEAAQAAAESVAESIPSDYSQLSEDVSDLREELNSIANVKKELAVYAEKESDSDVLPEGFTTGKGYIRNMTVSNPGNISTSENSRWFAFYLSEDADIYVPLDKSGVGTYRNICVYTSAGPNTNNRVTPVYRSGSTDYPLPTESTPLRVLAGQCVAFSYNNVSVPLEDFSFIVYKIVDSGFVLNDNLPLTAEMDSEVEALIASSGADVAQTVVDTARENLYVNDGWEQLPAENFARNAWSNYNTTDSRTYRVRYTEALTFDRDVTLLAKAGFYICAFTSDSSAYYDVNTYINLPANKTIHLYVRRIIEDTTETADVSTFADALLVSTPLADIERLKPTFTDISMFERVGVCGDSYAAGGGIISGIRSLTWGKNLERQAGITVDIYARSGQNVVEWVDDSSSGLVALLAGTECGLYWMAHGINGTSTEEALGTADDMSASPHPDTFYGQYVEAIEQMQTAFPNAKIVLQTICGSSYKLYQTIYADVNSAIRAIAEYCGVPVVDVADDDFYKSSAYSSNIRSNHPTAMVAAGMAQANRRLLSKCILDNTDYFIDYGSN